MCAFLNVPSTQLSMDIKTELNWMSVCLLYKSAWFKFIILMWTHMRVCLHSCFCTTIVLFIQHNIVFASNSSHFIMTCNTNAITYNLADMHDSIHTSRIIKWLIRLVRNDSLRNLYAYAIARWQNVAVQCAWKSECEHFLFYTFHREHHHHITHLHAQS